MSSAAAAHAAGVAAFTEVGDGVLQPSGPLGSSQPYLYLSQFAGQPAASFGGDFTCVGAGGSESATQSVVTTLGLRLGDPAARVREIYGTAANFIPMPTTGGIDPNPGYVVHQGQFDLVFKLDPSQSRVIAIAGGLAPMLGQLGFYAVRSEEKAPLPIKRFTEEGERLFGVLERRLGEAAYLAGDDYTIADVASFPWCLAASTFLAPVLGERLTASPNFQRWLKAVGDRPAVQRGMAVPKI